MSVLKGKIFAKSAPKESYAGFFDWFKRSEKTAFLRSWKSPFYFFVFVFLVGIFWNIYGIIENNFSAALNWDYSHQYLPFVQSYYDTWRHFFASGEFRLYDTVTFLGADNIGSNAYYGLFDPFMLIIIMFPREAVPQTFLICTIIKLTLCAYFSRKFLKYRGISEGASRFGALAIAFSGYMNFMVGFPTFVAALTYVPLILYGIEKVIREKRIGALSIGVFLMMLSCFLLTVTMCIWGVMYAVFRYFVTFRERKGKDNLIVIGAGVLGFAIGIMLSAWVLIPSFRASSSTGRTVSIGNAYMHALLDAIKALDFQEAFRLFFLEVGENPGRELMGLISFFFPTGGFQALPLLRYGAGTSYDAWVASYFCYTPFILLFFQAIIFSIKEKRMSHVLAILGVLTLLFTTFAYYFFFGFSGNGYGRWYFVLVPSIVYYGCWAYDKRKDAPRWIPITGSLLAFVATILAYMSIYWVLEGVRASGTTYVTYYPSTYLMPTDSYEDLARYWYLIYELVLIFIEGLLLLIGYRKKWLSHVMLIFVAAEAVAMGNTAYYYIGLWSIDGSYMGGAETLSTSRSIAEKIDEQAKDESFYRVNFAAAKGTTNFQYAVGEPASSSFHSLINYADCEFAYLNQMMNLPSTSSIKSYNDTPVTSYSWSASYRNKRYATDYALGYRYYVEENYPSDNDIWIGESVPFGAKEIESASPDRNRVRVYRVDDEFMPSLGHGIDPNYIYRMGKESEQKSTFYGFSRTARNVHRNNLRNHMILTNGAIIDDDFELPKGFAVSEVDDLSVNSYNGYKVLGYKSGYDAKIYSVDVGDYLFASKTHQTSYGDNTVGYFFDHNTATHTLEDYNDLINGKDHLILTPTSGDYFNTDENGAYFLITKTWNSTIRNRDGKNFLRQPRVIFFGDDNKVLGYDATTFGSVAADGEMTSYYSGYSGSCGFYASGKVKAICLLWPTNTSLKTRVQSSDFLLSVIPYGDIASRNGENQSRKLEDVKKIKNGYTFSTNYPNQTIVTTQLGYDEGWKVYSNSSSGKKPLETLRINGGLQGFIAPSGETTYTMVYETPGLTLGFVAAIGGGMLFAGYVVLTYLLDKNRAKKELANIGEPETSN
ncbi:MAG: YfhO family protein [Bacilli bacterium]|nr:YfhO family protein [Bacilli bacterium]